MDLNKMKVNDLKAELQKYGLDTKGVKAVLVERLKEAMEKENAGTGTEVSTPTVAATKKLDVGTPNLSTPVRRSRRRSMTRSPSPVKTEVTPLDSVSEEPEQAELADSSDSSVRKKRRTRSITKSPSPVKPSAEKRLDVLEEEEADTVTPTESPQKSAKPESPVKAPATPTKPATPATPTKPATPVTPTKPASPVAKAVSTPSSTAKQQTSPQVTPEKSSVDPPSVAEPKPEKMATEEIVQPEQPQNPPPAEETEADVGNASATESLAENDGNDEEATEATTEEQSGDTSVDKGKPGTGEKDSNKKKALTPIEFVSDEVEPDIDADKFALSWFDSHLNLEINPETFDTAKPLSDGALAMVWAGARANLGVCKGKVAYEVLLTQANTTHKVTEEAVTAEFRAGWSTSDADLQLGEAKHSFAYGSDGQKGTECTFSEYGATYKVNDVIGIYLDLESSPCKIEYTVNGASQGVAFEFDVADLNGQALFPHVYSKNIAFKVNFGQLERSLLNDRQPEKKKEQPKTETKDTDNSAEKDSVETAAEEDKKVESTESANEEAKTQEETETKATEQVQTEEEEKEEEVKQDQELKVINPDYIYIAETAKENLAAGITRPENRCECEVILMIGMPGSGKTYWVKNYLTENPKKQFTVLSVDSLLDQMKLSGKPRLPANTNKWSKLVDQLGKNLNKLNEIAAKRRRNFILDQTNTFVSEQKRRLRGFGGYEARRAIVVVPDDEEYNRRLKEKQETYGVEVQEGQMNVMKAHFHLPTLEHGWFTEFNYVELEEEKAREVVQKLNEAGRKLLPRGYNRNQQSYQQHNRRGAGNNQQRWNQGNRYGNQQYQQQGGGYNAQHRYNNAQQYSQNRNFRPGNGYGRQGSSSGYGGGARYGNNDWTRNNTGSYDNRFNNRGYQNNRTRGYDRNRGYNSGWNQQNSNCWGYGSQNNDTQQWYSWWQSNLKNLLQQQGGNGSDNNAQSNIEQYWSQYAQQHNYGNYHQSKSHGSGSSSKNK